MSIEALTNSALAPAMSATARSQKTTQTDTGEKPSWTVEDVIGMASASEGTWFSVGRRMAATDVKFVQLNVQWDEFGRGSGVELKERPRDLSAQEASKFNQGLGGTLWVMSGADSIAANGMAHRQILDRYADEHQAEFEDFIRQGVAGGQGEGTDWQESFFLDRADDSAIATYQSAKAEGNEANILSDKRGRYLAQYGVDLSQPLGLTKLDDGTYAEVSGHPQKQYIERLVNSAPDLWSPAWD